MKTILAFILSILLLGSCAAPSNSTDSKNSISSSSSKGGTVHVKSYVRKDGTVVKSHTRSSPKKK